MSTILVVDDNATNRSFLVTLLGYRGHRVVEATNGAEALDRARAERPDLVITDIVMPAVDGFELLRQLRSDPVASAARVVFYSATYLESEARSLAEACGVSQVISKPADAEHILEVVESTLAREQPIALVPAPDEHFHSNYTQILNNKLCKKMAELETLNIQLEQRVTERTAQLSEANYSLEEQIAEHRVTKEALQQANEKLAQRVSELNSRTQEVVLLGEMGHLLQTCLTTEEAYIIVKQFAERLLACESGALYLLNPARDLYETAAVWGESAHGCQQLLRPGDCWAVRRGRPHAVGGGITGPICGHIGSVTPAGCICIPMAAQGETLGVLSLRWAQLEQNHQPDQLEARERLALAVADTVALSLANLKLQEHLREQSIRDHLTGLFNRRYLEESLEREVHRASRAGISIGIMMLDIDHFKRFNDTFGHPAGDKLLQSLGLYLREYVRGEDIACRYGGEEFALILPGASLEITQVRAEMIRKGAVNLSNELMRHLDSSPHAFTLSLGVAAFPAHGMNGESVLRAADKALYQAKQSGRDRVVVVSTKTTDSSEIAKSSLAEGNV